MPGQVAVERAVQDDEPLAAQRLERHAGPGSTARGRARSPPRARPATPIATAPPIENPSSSVRGPPASRTAARASSRAEVEPLPRLDPVLAPRRSGAPGTAGASRPTSHSSDADHVPSTSPRLAAVDADDGRRARRARWCASRRRWTGARVCRALARPSRCIRRAMRRSGSLGHGADRSGAGVRGGAAGHRRAGRRSRVVRRSRGRGRGDREVGRVAVGVVPVRAGGRRSSPGLAVVGGAAAGLPSPRPFGRRAVRDRVEQRAGRRPSRRGCRRSRRGRPRTTGLPRACPSSRRRRAGRRRRRASVVPGRDRGQRRVGRAGRRAVDDLEAGDVGSGRAAVVELDELVRERAGDAGGELVHADAGRSPPPPPPPPDAST